MLTALLWVAPLVVTLAAVVTVGTYVERRVWGRR